MKRNLKPALAGIIFFLPLSLITTPLLSQAGRVARAEAVEKLRNQRNLRLRAPQPFPSPGTRC